MSGDAEKKTAEKKAVEGGKSEKSENMFFGVCSVTDAMRSVCKSDEEYEEFRAEIEKEIEQEAREKKENPLAVSETDDLAMKLHKEGAQAFIDQYKENLHKMLTDYADELQKKGMLSEETAKKHKRKIDRDLGKHN